MGAFEDSGCRRSIVADTLQCLKDEGKLWRDKIDQLEAGQPLDRAETTAALGKLLDVCQNLRDVIFSEDNAATWKTREELHALVRRLDDVAAKRRRYLDLAQLLGAGSVTHRRERTRQERLAQRDAAVAELMEVSALGSPPDLPGPRVEEWLSWACNLDDSSNDPELLNLKNNFPRVDDFVRQLEVELWRDGHSRLQEQLIERVPVADPDPESGSAGGGGKPATDEGAHPPGGGQAYGARELSEEPSSICTTQAASAAVEPELPDLRPAPEPRERGSISFFAAEEIEYLSLQLERAKRNPAAERKVRALLAFSHWLAPLDQNPVMHAKSGVRAQIGYAGPLVPAAASPDEAARAIESSKELLLFEGGADLLRWSLAQPAEDGWDAIVALRRLTAEQLRAWFGALYRIELAEPQVQDMYRLTFGIPLLVGELHRLTIPVPDMPPTWLGYGPWTRIKSSFTSQLPLLARELRSGAPSVRLTEREISVLKMAVIASDDSTAETMAANLMENWEQYHRREFRALSWEDEGSVRVLENLGLLPMGRDAGLRPMKALLPVDADDPIRQIVGYL